MARGSLLNRNEPTDAVRAVNAVLTQVDRIRRRTNVFILTTSNIVHVNHFLIPILNSV